MPWSGRQTVVPVRSAGIRSGVHWMRAKRGVEAGRQALDRARLGQARRAFDENVAAGQQADQQTLDQARHADEPGFEPAFQLADAFAQGCVGDLADRRGSLVVNVHAVTRAVAIVPPTLFNTAFSDGP